ncbi:MAG: M48 family metalloprotease [Thermofilum sp.]
MYVKSLYLPLLCFSRSRSKPEDVLLALQRKGLLSFSLRSRWAGCETWRARTHFGDVLITLNNEEKLIVESEEKKALDFFLKSFFLEVSALCRAEPELVIVFLGDQLLPVGGSRLAAFLSRGALGVLVFAAVVTCLEAPLSALGIPFLLSTALAFSISLPIALLLGPAVALRALPRWRMPHGQPLRIIVAKLVSLDSDVELAASFAKLSLAKKPGELTPDAVISELESWGVPVRGVSVLEFPSPAARFCNGGECPEFFLTTSRRVLAVSYSALGGSKVVLGVDALIDLDQDEVHAVVAHELSHIKHGDSATLTLVASLVGLLLLAGLEVLLLNIPALIAVFLAGVYAVTLLWRALELRADLEAALKAGRAPLRRALIKLEYPSLAKSSSPHRRILSVFLPTAHPPVWLRLAALEKACLQKNLFREALKIIASSLFLAVEAHESLPNPPKRGLPLCCS